MCVIYAMRDTYNDVKNSDSLMVRMIQLTASTYTVFFIFTFGWQEIPSTYFPVYIVSFAKKMQRITHHSEHTEQIVLVFGPSV